MNSRFKNGARNYVGYNIPNSYEKKKGLAVEYKNFPFFSKNRAQRRGGAPAGVKVKRAENFKNANAADGRKEREKKGAVQAEEPGQKKQP